MSKPGTIYRINFQSFSPSDNTGEPESDIQGFVDILDNDHLIGDGEDETIYEVTGAANSPALSVIDNNEDPFTPILAQQLTVAFASTANVNASTFASGSDQRWGVHYYIGDNTKTVFKGFLVLDDISEPLQDPPNIVTLTANDGLGLLKEIPLVNADGDNPQGYHRISDYLSWCLRRTGLDLEMTVAFNIKLVGDNSDISIPNTDPEHLFYNTFLEAKTFEDEIGTSINSYETISRILAEEAVLFQMKGAWWILRRDEVESATRGLYITRFDSSGSFAENLGEIQFPKVIGRDEVIQFSQEITDVTFNRPHKSVRLEYIYETPRETPCNIDFSRGDLIDGTDPLRKKYELDCWTKHQENYPTSGLITATTDIYVIREFNSIDYETNRYIVIEAHTPSSNLVMSEAIPVSEKDKISVSMSRRLNADVSGSGFYRDNGMQVRLIGDDGTYWVLQGETSVGDTLEWVQSNADFTINNKYLVFEGDVSRDMTEPESLYGNTESPAIPVDGTIYLLVHQTHVAAWGRDTYIDNIDFDYIPYINGSYQKYSGQYHRTSQDGNYKAKRERQVYISDSPKKLFKGALHIFNGSSYELAGLFYNAAPFPAGPPSSDWHHPYGEIQLFDVWNQFRSGMRLIRANCQGLDLDQEDSDGKVDMAHLINKWSSSDVSAHLSNKLFIALSFNQNHDNGEWSGVLREVDDTTRTKDYSNHEFKYIS